MDGISTLQSSAPETKAERIARYKAERRRELAERYGTTDEFTSKYVRRERKTANASETFSSESREKGKSEGTQAEQSYTRRGLRNREPVERSDETDLQLGGTTHLKAEPVKSSVMTASNVRWAQWRCNNGCIFLLYWSRHIIILILRHIVMVRCEAIRVDSIVFL